MTQHEDRRREEDRDRLDDEHRADAGADAAAAPEPGEDAPDGPGHGGRAAQHLDQRIAGHGRATSTGTAPLSRSPRTTTAAHLRPRARSALVPPVRPEADRAQVRSADPPRHERPDRDGPEQVRHRPRARARSGSRVHAMLRGGSEVRAESSTGNRATGRPLAGPAGRSVSDGVASPLLDGDRALDDGRAEDAVGVHRRRDDARARALAADRQRVARALAGGRVGGGDDAGRRVGRIADTSPWPIAFSAPTRKSWPAGSAGGGWHRRT